jgi:glucose/mannose transport system substrate-binding protein
MKFKKSAVVAASVAAALMLSSCASSSGGSASGKPEGDIEVFSWWTSGSEDAALQSIIKAAEEANPGLTITNAAVAGGGGTNSQQVLATRLSGGDIPENWQTHPGGALKDYYDQGVLTDLTDVYKSEGWDKVVPKELIDSVSFDGKNYSVFTGVHRGNVIWINKEVAAKAGVDLSGGISWDQFESAAKKIQATGVAPLCLGDKDIWTAAQLLESILLGELGADKYAQLQAGKISWSDPAVLAAVDHFNTAMTYTNADHKALDWTGAVDAFAKGTCAMNVMGDWEYGELLVKQKKVDGTDFGYAYFGDANDFLTVGDSFVVGNGSKNPAGAIAFVKAIMDPKAQLAFNKLKGSSPVRSDVDTSTLGVYQQGAAKTLAEGKKVPSLTHGQASVPAAVGQAYADAVTLLEANQDAAAFGAAMDKAVKANK